MGTDCDDGALDRKPLSGRRCHMVWDWKLVIGIPAAILAVLGIRKHLADRDAERVRSVRVEAKHTLRFHDKGYSATEITLAGASPENWEAQSARVVTHGAEVSCVGGYEPLDDYGNVYPTPERWDTYVDGRLAQIIARPIEKDVTIEFTTVAKADPTQTATSRITIKGEAPPADVHPA